jgi:ADP-ribosylglycohydrolase
MRSQEARDLKRSGSTPQRPARDAQELTPPLPNSYWVFAGRLLGGEYPGATDSELARERIERLLASGIDCFVNLTGEQLPPYEALLPPSVRYFHRPIRDHDLPPSREHMVETLDIIASALRANRCVYVHCRAGIGRTGVVLGCLLVESGMAGESALEHLNEVWRQSARSESWPSVPETDAQVEYVRTWEPSVVPYPSVHFPEAVIVEEPAAPSAAEAIPAPGPIEPLGRFVGALVGLAVGDALAAATQDQKPGTFTAVSELTGGGPFNLPRGAWSDDTAMALCLAESLLACAGFDPRDQIERYSRWQQHGYCSATGQCLGIRSGTARALAAARWRRQVFSGSHDPKQLDPEPLTRVAPVVMYFFARVEEAVQLAGDAARTTCQAPTVVEACRVFGAMVHAALAGLPKAKVLAPEAGLEEAAKAGFRPRTRSLLAGRYRGKRPAQVRAGDTIGEALEAALWAFARTDTFQEGALLTANLGDSSDVATAAFGQLAGAYYGVAGIPPAWRNALLELPLIERLAAELAHATLGAQSGKLRP